MAGGSFVVWSEKYTVGNRQLDNHHKEIITIINSLYTAIKDDVAQDKLRRILRELYEYTRLHFGREEELMRKSGFPKLSEHRELHRDMVARTRELQREELRGDPEVVSETMSFLKKWWLTHIGKVDAQYRPFVEKLSKAPAK